MSAGPFTFDLRGMPEEVWLGLPGPDRDELTMLRDAGATEAALREVKAFHVVSFMTCFVLARHPDEGERAFLVPIRDWSEAVIDIAAWPIKNPSRLGRFTGLGSVLGEHLVANPATYYGGKVLPVFRDPVRWLAADAHGLVIVDWDEAGPILGDVPALAVEDVEHGRELVLRLAPAVDAGRVFVPRRQIGAAA